MSRSPEQLDYARRCRKANLLLQTGIQMTLPTLEREQTHTFEVDLGSALQDDEEELLAYKPYAFNVVWYGTFRGIHRLRIMSIEPHPPRAIIEVEMGPPSLGTLPVTRHEDLGQ